LEAINGGGTYDIQEALLQSLEGVISPSPRNITKKPVFEPGKPESSKSLAFVVCLIDCPQSCKSEEVELLCRLVTHAYRLSLLTRTVVTDVLRIVFTQTEFSQA